MSYFELPEPRRERCPFCDNVAGRETEGGVRCAVVLETDLTLTFVAPRRQHLGRLLVISKRHAPTLLDLTDEEAAAIMRDTRRAALALTRAFKPDGLTIHQNNGVGAGHEIPHVHLHVVPRYHDDGGANADKGPVIAYERPLRDPGLAARKTPHRFRPRTPEPASPLGEGEERRDQEGRTPHRFRPKTPESASPPGEGKERRPLEEIDTTHPPLGLRKDLQGEREGERLRVRGEERFAVIPYEERAEVAARIKLFIE